MMAMRPALRCLGIERLLTRAARQYTQGADLSSLILPRWLDAILNHDWVAYPLHAGCGAALNRLHASPKVAALEWLKAAAHAGSPASQHRIAAGLRNTVARAGHHDLQSILDAATIRPVTQDGRDVRMRRRQLAVMAHAGLTVPATGG